MSGTYSPAQRDLYNAVLNVQRECVDLCTEKAGISLDGLHGRAEEGLRRELVGLGFDVRGKVSVRLSWNSGLAGFSLEMLRVGAEALIVLSGIPGGWNGS